MDERQSKADTPLVANAVSAVRELISVPAYSIGARLPSEADLAERIGVSRPVLRQALAVLKQEGLIESRRGSGTYTAGKSPSIFAMTNPPTTLSFGNPETLGDLEDCMRFRMVIESSAAGIAARRADLLAISRIRDAVQMMESGQSKENSVLETDLAFHRAVAAATHSRYYVMTLETLMPHVLFGLRLARQLRQMPVNITSRRVAAEHHAILSAIESGNETMAAESMKEHLSSGIERIFGNRSW